MVVTITIKDPSVKEVEAVQLWEGGPYWATTNIGAENPEDYGYYFWWGDTVGYKRENNKWVASDGSNSNYNFSEGNTPTYNQSASSLKSKGWITADGVLTPEHDAAHVHWGDDWRMPTKEEIGDLVSVSKCTWTLTTNNGVAGFEVRGKGEYASNSIFLPMPGIAFDNQLQLPGQTFVYWSSTVEEDYGKYAWGLQYEPVNGNPYLSDKNYRWGGLPIRPVK